MKVNCKYYHDGCMVTGLRSTMEEHEERFLHQSMNIMLMLMNIMFGQVDERFLCQQNISMNIMLMLMNIARMFGQVDERFLHKEHEHYADVDEYCQNVCPG